MQHSHQHSDSHDLGIVFVLNVGFTLLEIVGGLIVNSVAILSDAVHDLGDSLALGLAWFLQRFSHKERDIRYSYGYRRYSLLGALISALILTLGSLLILSEAIPRLFDPQSFDASGMIGLAVIGVIVNFIAAYRLRGTTSPNAQTVGWHLLEDVLGWIGVLVVGIISLFANVPILDPLLSIAITLYILGNVMMRLWKSTEIFLQAVPDDVDLQSTKDYLRGLDDVNSIHHTHIWSLDGENNVFSTHLVVDDDTRSDEIITLRKTVKEYINEMNVEHATIAVEYEREHCALRNENPKS